LSTLGLREEFLRICSKKDSAELAQGIEVTVQFKIVKTPSTKILQPHSSVLLHTIGLFVVQATGWGCNQ